MRTSDQNNNIKCVNRYIKYVFFSKTKIDQIQFKTVKFIYYNFIFK